MSFLKPLIASIFGMNFAPSDDYKRAKYAEIKLQQIEFNYYKRLYPDMVSIKFHDDGSRELTLADGSSFFALKVINHN